MENALGELSDLDGTMKDFDQPVNNPDSDEVINSVTTIGPEISSVNPEILEQEALDEILNFPILND